MVHFVSLCFVCALVLRQVESFSVLIGTIPNGNAVPNPCGRGIWAGVGHLSPLGGGPPNQFGIDFELNNFVWTRGLCRRDSDGDGITNGAELGDPGCRWTPGLQPFSRPRGHPGICEPLTAPQCINQFNFCGPNPGGAAPRVPAL